MFFGRGNEGTRICTDVYKNSRDLDGLFGFEVCIRGVLGRWSHFDKVKIFRKVSLLLYLRRNESLGYRLDPGQLGNQFHLESEEGFLLTRLETTQYG